MTAEDLARIGAAKLRVVVTGSREWGESEIIANRISRLPRDGTVIVHGDCRGADRIADVCARALGYCVIPVPADWKKHGKSAGPIRNRQMLDLRPHLVLAFHDNLRQSTGTKNCVDEAMSRGIQTVVYTSRT